MSYDGHSGKLPRLSGQKIMTDRPSLGLDGSLVNLQSAPDNWRELPLAEMTEEQVEQFFSEFIWLVMADGIEH